MRRESMFILTVRHRPRLRTSNAAERLNQEIKGRTRVAQFFPNTDSLLRLVTEFFSEISDG